MPAEDEAESTTKATVSEGEIEIRDKENQKQDLAGLNRDTQNPVNKLAEIFDKNDVKEKQEFIGLAQELGHKMIGDLTGKISLEQKAMLNTFLEGFISKLANGDFSGAAGGAAAVEMAKQALWEIEDPAVRQYAAWLIGATASKILSGDSSTGGSAAIVVEKYNGLSHEEQEKIAFRLEHALTQDDRYQIIYDALQQSKYNRENNPQYGEAIEQYLLDELEKICKYDKGIGVTFTVDRTQGLHNNLIEAEAFFDLYNTFKTIGEVGYETAKFAIDVTADVIILSKVKVVKNIIFVGGTAYTIVNDSKKYGGIYDEYGNINEDTAKVITNDVIQAVGFNIIAMNGIEKRIDTIEGLEHKDYIVATVEGIGDLVLEKLKNY